MTRSWIRSVGVTLVALAIVACGSGTTAPTGTPAAGQPTPTPAAGQPTPVTGSTVIPCDKIGPQVAAIVGLTADSTPSANDTATSCEFGFVDAGSGVQGAGGLVVVTQSKAVAGDLGYVKLAFPDAVAADGIGDAGMWSALNTVLYANYHGATWSVQLVLNSAPANAKTTAMQVMNALFNNLP